MAKLSVVIDTTIGVCVHALMWFTGVVVGLVIAAIIGVVTHCPALGQALGDLWVLYQVTGALNALIPFHKEIW